MAVIILAAALGFRAGPAAAATLSCDDDRSQRPPAEFTSIQAAVSDPRATPRTTIMVCPGRYREAIVVTTSGLTLRALRPPTSCRTSTNRGRLVRPSSISRAFTSGQGGVVDRPLCG